MSEFKDELKKVKAFVFDVDGVLSKDTSPLNSKGDPVRTANVKDGFAIRTAIALGYPVAIITGGDVERVRLRLWILNPGCTFMYLLFLPVIL